MIIDRLRHLVTRFSAHSDDVSEHQAIVELLVLTAYCDHACDQSELDAFDIFDQKHEDWDGGAFSVQEYLPVAVAKARKALDETGGVNKALTDAASRITHPPARAEAIKICESLADIDGRDTSEVEFLKLVRRALA